jgi:hypothetical protein
MKKTHIAFLDILGFSQRTFENDLHDFFKQYKQALDEGLKGYRARYLISSDSIVIFATDPWESGLGDLGDACARLQYELLTAGFPVRGAIAYGSYAIHDTKRGTLLIGKALAEAVAWEKQQDWLGVILAPSAARENPYIAGADHLSHEDFDASRVRPELVANGPAAIAPWRVPVKGLRSPAYYEAYASIPRSAKTVRLFKGSSSLPAVADALDSAIEDLNGLRPILRALKSAAPDGSAQQKYRNTDEFFKAQSQILERISTALRMRAERSE